MLNLSNTFTPIKRQGSTNPNTSYSKSPLQSSNQDTDFLMRMRQVATDHVNSTGGQELNPMFYDVKAHHERENGSQRRASRLRVQETKSKSPLTKKQRIENSAHKILDRTFKSSADYKFVMKKIYYYYISVGDRINSEGLKMTQLSKLILDTSILEDTVLTQIDIDLLYAKYKAKASHLDFDHFLLLMVDLAELSYENCSKRVAFAKFFDEFLKPLCYNLYTQTEMGEWQLFFQETLTHNTKSLLKEVAPVLQRIHAHCFNHEYYHHTDLKVVKSKSELHLPLFLKNFALCPSYISLSNAHFMVQELCNLPEKKIDNYLDLPDDPQPDTGRAFTFKRFMLFLARVSALGENPFEPEPEQEQKENKENYNWRQADKKKKPKLHVSQKDKLHMMLETMELSVGFKEFRVVDGSPDLSLVPGWALLKQRKRGRKGATYRDGRALTATPQRGFSPQFSPNLKNAHFDKNSPHRKNLEFSFQRFGSRNFSSRSPEKLRNASKQAFSDNYEMLRDIFRAYCPRSKTQFVMKPTDMAHLLEDAGLINDSFTQSRLSTREPTPTRSKKFGRINWMSRLDLEIILRKYAGVERQGKTFDFNDYGTLGSEHEKEDHDQDPTAKNYQSLQNGHLRITFDVFLKTLEQCAFHVYPDVKKAMAPEVLVKMHLAKIAKEERLIQAESDVKGQLKLLLSILRNKVVMDVLAKMKRKLRPFYENYYLLKTQFFDFNGFLEFCRDFCIFPFLLSRAKLKVMFYNLAAIYPLVKDMNNSNANKYDASALQRTVQKKKDPLEGDPEDLIDENLLVEGLGLIAVEIHRHEKKHVVDKIISLMWKILETMRPRNRVLDSRTIDLMNSQKAIGDIIWYIKEKYGEYLDEEEEQKLHTFDDMFLVKKETSSNKKKLFDIK